MRKISIATLFISAILSTSAFADASLSDRFKQHELENKNAFASVKDDIKAVEHNAIQREHTLDTKISDVSHEVDNLDTRVTSNTKRIDELDIRVNERVESSLQNANEVNRNYADLVGKEVEHSANTYTDNSAQKTLASANEYTDVAVGAERNERIAGDKATLNSANAYTNKKFSDLKKTVDTNKRQANAGVSAALAASQIPQVTAGKNFSLGAGLGAYRDQSAIAVGISARLNANTVTKVSVTADSSNALGLGAGVSYEW